MNFSYNFPRPSVTVDSVVLRTPMLDFPEVLLIKRGREPFKDCWALPGGFLDMHESPLHAAARELEEETTLKDLPLKPVFTCAQPDRDPRGRTISIVYACLIRDSNTTAKGMDDASQADWFSLNELPKLAFDHNQIIKQIINHLLWQANNLIVGNDVFHSVASVKEIIRLHSNLGVCTNNDFLQKAEEKHLIKCNQNICQYINCSPAGPDWHPLVW